MDTPILSNEERMKQKAAALRRTKEAYGRLILCGQEDPYPALMKDRTIKVIVGPKGSNLLAQVRIKNSGREAQYYRRLANKLLNADKSIQIEIQKSFLEEGDELVISAARNPVIIKRDGEMTKFCWHHSPNHIASISLIPQAVHTKGMRELHIEGRGGNDMYTVMKTIYL